MLEKKTTIGISVILLLIAFGLGFWIGGKKGSDKTPEIEINSFEIQDIKDKDQAALMRDLSDIMMPKDEYEKLIGAVLQTGMGLMGAKSQGQGIDIKPGVETQLKARIENKYSRSYFTDLNAKSMEELTKPELEAILIFYKSSAGQKFLRLSPMIIETTMKNVQMDLAKWLPEEIEKMLSEMKEGEKINKGNNNQ